MNSHRLKLKLIKDGIKEHRCENCNRDVWFDAPIALELHHIDGNSKNNDISNLELLCPNCHALTYNYRGRNKKRVVKVHVTDEDIINAVTTSFSRREALLKLGLVGYGGNYKRINRIVDVHNLQFKLSPRKMKGEDQLKRLQTIQEKYGTVSFYLRTKINWPSKEELIEMLKIEPIVKIAKKLGVSDSAVRKTAQKYEINILEVSLWAKKHNPRKTSKLC